MDHGFKSTVHPSGFFFEYRTANPDAGLQQALYSPSLNQGVGVRTSKDYRSDTCSQYCLGAGRGASVVVAGFQANVKGSFRGLILFKVFLAQEGTPCL
jgi:hypothetical protein